MAAVITNEEKVGVSVSFFTDKGKPAKVDGAPVWKSSDESVATVVPSADGMSASIVSVDGAEGTATISVEGDADLGAGVVPVGASDTVLVTSPQASSASFTFGAPEQK
jgi:hypothetical protein